MDKVEHRDTGASTTAEIGCLAKASGINEVLDKINEVLDCVLGSATDAKGEEPVSSGTLGALERELKAANFGIHSLHSRVTQLADRLGE